MKQITIKVTQEDIDKGGKTQFNCPVAQSLGRLEEHEDIQVWPAKIWFDNAPFGWDTSKRLKAYIDHYDKTGEAKPATFRLRR